MEESGIDTIRYRVTGMDCASCAGKIETAARAAGIADPSVSTTTQILSFDAPTESGGLSAMEQSIRSIGYQLERVSDDEKAEPHHLAPAYRRALWIVIALNVGYGVVELAGGYLSGSQALKADALDFLGDGLITLLGVVAIGWSLIWRARLALVQGLFLCALGMGVVIDTGFRIFLERPIEAGMMGAFGLVALIVNIAAALVLMPHRHGDANMKAVWLFSRNDAIGNAAVVVAAAVVYWSNARWPDIVVAFAISGLFLQSAWIIIRDARREL